MAPTNIQGCIDDIDDIKKQIVKHVEMIDAVRSSNTKYEQRLVILEKFIFGNGVKGLVELFGDISESLTHLKVTVEKSSAVRTAIKINKTDRLQLVGTWIAAGALIGNLIALLVEHLI